ncbi:MAG: hypothetical protein NXI32_18170 [bacterium]|nr:hypothetical protein [bacterium]
MLIRAEWIDKLLIIKTQGAGLAYVADDWPEDHLPIQDLLRCLFGWPLPDGWFCYHEQDHRLLFEMLDQIKGVSFKEMLSLAILDYAQIANKVHDTDLVLASSIAVLAIEKAFGCTREEAGILVRMNLNKRVAA